MINLTPKQQRLVGDIGIAVGMLLLAFLLKDSSEQAQTSGMLTMLAAIFIRLNCRSNKSSQ